jgi:hypothetical protein
MKRSNIVRPVVTGHYGVSLEAGRYREPPGSLYRPWEVVEASICQCVKCLRDKGEADEFKRGVLVRRMTAR